MKTMQKASMMPAMPTTHVSRRKRMTPKMFCRHGRYTPMKVPMRGACQGGWRQFLQPPHPYQHPRPSPLPQTFIPLPAPPSLPLISHSFPSLRLHLLSFCLHHPSLHLNPFSSPAGSPLQPFFPKALTCTGFFFPPSLFSASSCSLLPWGRLV